jgi:hypothetical protein
MTQLHLKADQRLIAENEKIIEDNQALQLQRFDDFSSISPCQIISCRFNHLATKSLKRVHLIPPHFL